MGSMHSATLKLVPTFEAKPFEHPGTTDEGSRCRLLSDGAAADGELALDTATHRIGHRFESNTTQKAKENGPGARGAILVNAKKPSVHQ